MPAYSGFWDGMYNEAYSAVPKQDALPPVQRGIVRALMQGRGLHGHVTALGRNAPSVIAQIDAARDQIAVPGTFDYAAWKADPTTIANRDVDITNAASHSSDEGITESIARPADAAEGDMLHTYDTTLRNGHPADAANNGVTSPAVAEVISDGT